MTITELRAKLGKEVSGDPYFNGTPSAYSELTADEQITLTNKMVAYIKANPSEFKTTEVNTASKINEIPLTEKYTMGDMFSDFGNEVLNQAEDLNPLSERNRTKTFITIAVMLTVIGVAFVYVNKITPNASK